MDTIEFLITPIGPFIWAYDTLFVRGGTSPLGTGASLLLLFAVIVSFYAALIATAVLSWWGYAVIAYVAFFAAGYWSLRSPPNPEK